MQSGMSSLLDNTTAREIVLSTYELLENIFAHLSPFDIGVAVLVSAPWRDLAAARTISQQP